VGGITRETFIPESLILPQGIPALCDNPGLRTAILATLLTLDNSDVAVRQTGDRCDTPGAYFTLHQEIYPNLGCSVKISISRSHLSPFIKLLMNVSPSLELFDLKNSQIWSLLKLLFLKANANSKVNLVSQLPSRLIYLDSR
jgi:hypothetical protein